MTDNFTRYIVPNGGGIADHPSGLLYRREEVDPVVDALRTRTLADEQALKEANEAIKAAVVLAEASQALVDLQENTSPFGGEIMQDRIERTERKFIKALDAFYRAMRDRKGGE